MYNFAQYVLFKPECWFLKGTLGPNGIFVAETKHAQDFPQPLDRRPRTAECASSVVLIQDNCLWIPFDQCYYSFLPVSPNWPGWNPHHYKVLLGSTFSFWLVHVTYLDSSRRHTPPFSLVLPSLSLYLSFLLTPSLFLKHSCTGHDRSPIIGNLTWMLGGRL